MNDKDYRVIHESYLIELRKNRSRLSLMRNKETKKTKQSNLVKFIIKDIYLVCSNCNHKNFNSNISKGKNDLGQNVIFCNNCGSQIDYLGVLKNEEM